MRKTAIDFVKRLGNFGDIIAVKNSEFEISYKELAEKIYKKAKLYKLNNLSSKNVLIIESINVELPNYKRLRRISIRGGVFPKTRLTNVKTVKGLYEILN